MEIKIIGQAEAGAPIPGGMTFDVVLDQEDLAQLRSQADRALEIERSVPEGARSPLAGDADAYAADFVQTRATNDALEFRGIIPVATPHVSASGLVDGEPYTCRVHVHARPEIGLTSVDPIDLSTKRVAKPGFKAGDDNEDAYLDDEKVLRVAMIERLDSELPEAAMRALGDEYTIKFEHELAMRGMTSADFQATHQIDEEQYALMMTRRALSDARWNYVLDAVFVGAGFSITDDDLLAAFELQAPGYSKQLLELHELRNDVWMTIEKVRRGKALQWLRENVLK